MNKESLQYTLSFFFAFFLFTLSFLFVTSLGASNRDQNNEKLAFDYIEGEEEVCFSHDECTTEVFVCSQTYGCENTNEGMCHPMNQLCEENDVTPVCGCDGKVYLNECFAQEAKVMIAHEGMCGEDYFTDVQTDNEYYSAIQFVKKQGIIVGYDDGSFQAEKNVNRAEFLKIIAEARFDSGIIGDCLQHFVQPNWTYFHFYDVPVDSWYAPHVCILELEGVIGGYPDGTMRPENLVSFVEAAKIIIEGFQYSIEEDDIWYMPYVVKLADMNAIPVSITQFDQTLTRGEIAEIIYRVKANITGKPSQNLEGLQ